MSRLDHRRRLFLDRDVLHAGAVAGAACVLSAGLVYLGYFAHVVRTARRAPTLPERGETLLLFGKHAPSGRLDPDFAARIARAATLWRERRPRAIVLLGGSAPGHPAEAEVAHAALLAEGVAADAPLRLETASRDTLQNLRNARALLAAATPVDGASVGRVTLVSSRYHLARCALFARQLGFDWELCAAEPALRWNPGMVFRLAGEAAYVCWVDLGTRWARLIGHRRMLDRVT
ncbi:MAG: YdcF family protein [Pseudomonadota bacterium]